MLTSYVSPFQGNGTIDLPKPYPPASAWHFIKGLTGNTHPGAVLPFGKYSVLGYSGGYPCGCGSNVVNSGEPIGKISEEPLFYGLSHMHESGTGAIGVYYNYALTHPFEGTIPTFAPDILRDETAHPGYYAAETDTVFCEATVSRKIAVHRYRFKGGEQHSIAVDFANDGLYIPRLRGKASGTVRRVDEQTLSAEMVLSGITLYFFIRCEGGKTAELFMGEKLYDDDSLTLAEPEDIRFGGIFRTEGDCELRVSISAVSMAHAEELLADESRSFSEIRADADRIWEQMLSRIEIETDDQRELEIFYSNFYHTLIKPVDLSGEAFLFREKAQPFVTDVATMWDIYKTQLPLLFMLYPEISEKLLHTFLQFGKEYGYYPHCMLVSGNMGIESKQARMLAEFSICDAYYRGVKADYPALLALSEKDAERYPDFFSEGGCEMSSHTLDMAEAFSSLSKLAAGLGDTTRAGKFAEYGTYAAKAFDDDGMMRADSWYYEGNRYNYSFRPAHDRAARIRAAGSLANLQKEAERFFGFTEPENFDSRFEGFNNETDMEAPAFLHEVGLRDRMCEVIRSGLDCMFTTGIGGIPGNADSGGLTACYLWNVLGLFPLTGHDRVILGTPRYAKAVMHLPGGKDLTIERTGGDSIYPASVSIDGDDLPDFEISASRLQKGGTLRFIMR